MKKTMTLLLAVLIIAGASALVTAQEESAAEPKGSMMKEGNKSKDCAKCQKKAMSKSMVDVDDGLVVMMGDKLLKYDNDLNLIKDVTLPQDMMCALPKDGMKGAGSEEMKGSADMQ